MVVGNWLNFTTNRYLSVVFNIDYYAIFKSYFSSPGVDSMICE